MNNYLILTNDRVSPKFDARIKGILLDREHNIIVNPFNRFQKITGYNREFIVREGKGSEQGKLRDKANVIVQNDEPLFVVNSKGEHMLKTFSVDAEFFSLILEQKDKQNCDYKIVNIFSVVDCINREDSSLIYWDESLDVIYNINELVLDSSLIPNSQSMFLLAGVKAPVMIVHRELAEACLKAKLTGFSFCNIDGFVL
jgi:hypothetical protein